MLICLAVRDADAADFTFKDAASLADAINNANKSGGTNSIVYSGDGSPIVLTATLPAIQSNLTIDGKNVATISGGGTAEPFFVLSGTVNFQNMVIRQGKATGGAGVAGGGGMGAGGAIFVANSGSVFGNNTVTNVTVTNVQFIENSAAGGQGGGIGDAGGGGLNSVGGAGGGVSNGAPGLLSAYAGGVGEGGAGGIGGGGAGSAGNGGAGGFGGGGGYGGNVGGRGGFGGGGGAGFGDGGAGGFGGGAGGSTTSNPQVGGVGGGAGGNSRVSEGPPTGAGGGGAGFGGAIFVQSGAALTVGEGTFRAGTVSGGVGGGFSIGDQKKGADGASAGSDLFLMAGSTTKFAPATGKTLTFSGTIADDSLASVPAHMGFTPGSGVGAAVSISSGRVVYAANNTYSNGTTIDPGTTLQLGTGGVTGSVLGAVTNNGTLSINRSDSFTLANFISGSGGVSLTGPGTITLDQANTYTGATNIDIGASLSLGSKGSLATSSGVQVNGTFDISKTGGTTIKALSGAGSVTLGSATLTTGGSNTDSRFAGVISGSGGLVKTGTGALTLAGSNTYTGGTSIKGGVVSVSADSNLGAATGGLTFGGGTLQALGNLASARAVALDAGGGSFDSNGNVIAWSGAISGTGGLTKTGAGMLTLSGANTYSGGTTINGGVVSVFSDSNLGAATGGLTFDSGSLQVQASFSSARAITLNSGGARLDTNGHDLALSGPISGIGGFTKIGSGTLTLSGNNSYGGATTVGMGSLQAGAAGAFSSGSAFTVDIGATLDLHGFNQTIGSLSGAGSVRLGSATLTTGGNNADSSFAGVISGSGGLVKSGTGALTLSGANSYRGATTVGMGSLKAGAAGALSASSAFTVASGATLNLNGFDQTIASLSGAGSVTLGSATLTTGGNNANSSFSGTISGSGGLAKTGTGTLTLSAVNGYGGPTSLSAGTLQAGAVGAFSSRSAFTVTLGATLDLHGFDQTIASMSGAGSVALGSATLTSGGNNADSSFSGVISGSGGLVKTGTGTLTLSGANSYRGATSVSAGTLQAGAGGAFSSQSAYTVAAGATLDVNQFNQEIASLSGAGSVTLDWALLVTGRNNADSSFSGVISGNGALFKTGTGTMIMSGANSYVGGTHVLMGSLQAGAAGAFSSGSAFSVDSGATLDLNGFNQTILSLSGEGSVTLGSATLTTGGSNTDISFSGVISGSGGLVKTGDATLTLSGANSYAGATTVGMGSLKAGAAGAFSASSSFTVASRATLNLNGFDQTIASLSGAGSVRLGSATLTTGGNNADSIFAGVISGSGGVTKIGTGTLTLSGANSYGGATTVGTGALQAGGANAFSSGSAFTVASGATLDLNSFNQTIAALAGAGSVALGSATLTTGGNNADSSFSGVISGSGGLLKTGTGTLTLAGTINYTGDTTVAGGTLSQLNAFTIIEGATLRVENAAAYTIGGLLTNSGAIAINAGGTLSAAAGLTNTATGTIVNYGTVNDDLSNAGTVTNNGVYGANVATNTGAGRITNSATGTWTGNVRSNAAAIINNGVWTGDVLANTGSITNNLTWTGTIDNAGSFTNNANGTVSGLVTNSGTLTNAGILDGGLINAAGTAVVTGVVNGASALNGGILSGTGQLASLTVANGAVFAPGNATPGTSMTVTGNLALQPGAIYVVQLNPATSSFTAVGGRATIGGATVTANYAAGSYVPKQYAILTAAGGVAGTFSSVVNTNLPSGFKSSLSYDTTHAFLDLALVLAPPPGGSLSNNQQNVADAIVNSFNTSGGIALEFGSLTPAGVTQISGELATGSQQTTFNAMDQFLALITDPFIAGRGSRTGSGGSPNAYAEKKPPGDAVLTASTNIPTFEQRWSVWAAGFGGSQQVDGDRVVGSSGTTTSSVAAAAVGLDYSLSPQTLVGFALAGGGTTFSVANSLGSGRSDLIQAGVFMRHNMGPAYLTGGLAYGWQDIFTDRIVTVAGLDRLRARFNANAWSGRLEGGYRFASGGFGWTPYVAGQFSIFDLPTYSEQSTGSNQFALTYGGRSVTDTRSELGLRADTSFALTDAVLTLRGRAAWAHDYNPDRSIGASFLALPGAAFVVNGARQAADAALVTASAELKLTNGWSAAATFEGEFSNSTRSYGGRAVLRYGW